MTFAIIASAIFSLFVGLLPVMFCIRRLQYNERYWISIKACLASASWWVLLIAFFCLCVYISFFSALHFWKTIL